MSEPKYLHRESNSEWYARALREGARTGVDQLDLACNDGEEVRVVFILKGWVGPTGGIVHSFVERVWPEYHVVDHCRTRHGPIVTVGEGP